MRKIFPVDDLARDERFVRVHMAERIADGRNARQNESQRGPGRLTPDAPRRPRRRPPAHARHLRGRDPGPRGRRPHVLGLPGRQGHRGGARRHPVRAEARHGPPVLGRGPSRRDQLQALRVDGHRARRVLRVAVPLRGRLQPRPRAPAHRRQPRPRGPRHRRLQHDAGVRRPGRRPGPRVLRGLDARRRGHPREDGLGLAAPAHRRPTRTRQERALEFQRIVDKLFSLGGFRGEEDDSPVRLARRFRELAGFDTSEMDELAQIAKESREEAERLQAAARDQKLEAAPT